MHALSPIRPLPSLLRVLYSPFMNCAGWTCMRYGERIDAGRAAACSGLSMTSVPSGLAALCRAQGEVFHSLDSGKGMFTGDITVISGYREAMYALLPKAASRDAAMTHKTDVMATISIEAAPAAV